MEAIVLAGGLGTRLQSIISEMPKPMAPITNQPFLFYVLNWLEKNGITRVILSVGYKWEIIFKEFGERFNSIELDYSIEDSPLGTGGAVAFAMTKLKENQFFIINGGIYLANYSINKYFPFTEKFSFENEFMEKMVTQLSFGGLVNDNYFIDIGVPEDYIRAQIELPIL